MLLRPDAPVLAVVAPPRLARLRALLGLADDAPIGADFTGWSKLVLLTPTQAVLFPRDHTQVDALRRDVAALEAVRPLGIAEVPTLQALWEDEDLSPYPVAVVRRMPGVPLDAIIETIPLRLLADLFADLGRLAARWHQADPPLVPTLPRKESLHGLTTLAEELGLSPTEARTATWALARAHELDPVLVHGDLHEGQLLVQPQAPFTITGVIDWQTARVDHPFVEFDLGEWGTAIWRGHRTAFPELRRRAWDAYADARGLDPTFGPVFEWHHACAHARRLLGHNPFPVVHEEGVVGTVAEARAGVREALAAMRE